MFRCVVLSSLALPHTLRLIQAFIDVALFALVIVYLFLVTLAGITKLGIRILWISLFQARALSRRKQSLNAKGLSQLKRRASPPQGLMLVSRWGCSGCALVNAQARRKTQAAVLLVLAMLAVNALLMSLAPQYTSFGGQTYLDQSGVVTPCALNAPPGLCHLSQVSAANDVVDKLLCSLFANSSKKNC